MALRTIELWGSEILRRKAAEIRQVDDELRTLIDDMFETMYHAEGVGLAAPQIGISQRAIVVDVHDEVTQPFALINPRLVEASTEREKGEEGCLSIPGLTAVVERAARVVVEGLDRDGKPLRVEGTGLLGRCLQHEIDHLDGVLFVDKVSPLQRNMLTRKWKKRQ
ncbi:MAG: peptide deformylase [Gemmatimonadota bacterium]|nr:peptide deformylase [Gemmatimonadota bacterium]